MKIVTIYNKLGGEEIWIVRFQYTKKKDVIKEMIKCQNCGQEIPKESNFCPYCMKKFASEICGESIKNDKKLKKGFVIIAALLGIVGVIAAVFIISKLKDVSSGYISDENMSGIDMPTVDTESEGFDEGVWYSEACIKSAMTPMDEGGYELIIYKVDSEKILFSLYSYQTPPASRIAQIEYVEASIGNDGIVEFVYEDDGWGNQGEGKITLGEETIELFIQTTIVDENAMWSLEGTACLKKSSAEIPDESKDFMGLIGRYYYDVVNVMGLRELGSELDEYAGMRHYLENNVTILEEDGTISAVSIDYSSLNTYMRENLRFSEGINGNSTYEDFENCMEEITYTEDYNGENITCFKTKETLFPTYIKVTFKEGKIQNIYYFVSVS